MNPIALSIAIALALLAAFTPAFAQQHDRMPAISTGGEMRAVIVSPDHAMAEDSIALPNNGRTPENLFDIATISGTAPWRTQIQSLDEMSGSQRADLVIAVLDSINDQFNLDLNSGEHLPGNRLLLSTAERMEYRGDLAGSPVVAINSTTVPDVFIASSARQLECADLEPLDLEISNIPMAQITIVDMSGSMEGHLAEAFRAAEASISSMPTGATCGLMLFNGHLYNMQAPASLAPDRRWVAGQCGSSAWPGIFSNLNRNVTGNGGTASDVAILEALEFLHQPQFESHLRSVLVVTDGDNAEPSYDRIPEILRAKNGVSLWSHEIDITPSAFYNDISDGRSFEAFDAGASIEAAFQSYRDAQQSAFIVRARRCQAADLGTQTAQSGTQRNPTR